MRKQKIGVVGFGAIGARLADAVRLQPDMELLGVADTTPGLAVQALWERGMPYPLYAAGEQAFAQRGIPVAGTLEELVRQADVLLDASTPGAGASNRVLYKKYGKKAVFQAGEADAVAELYFHSYANYDAAAGKRFLKIPSCNTTGLTRVLAVLHTACGVQQAAVTILRRAADPGDCSAGIINGLRMDKAPTGQARDVSRLLPGVACAGILLHAPFTQGQTVTLVVSGSQKLTRKAALQVFAADPRIRIVNTDDGFCGNASIYQYARLLNAPHGDLWEIAVWEDSIHVIGDSLMFAIVIPQQSVTIPETLDAVRALAAEPPARDDALRITNHALGLDGK